MGKIFVGDVGTVIIIDCRMDISDATLLQIVVRKPTGVKLTWSASLYGTTSVSYTVGVGDLDVVGTWHLQPVVVKPGWSGSGEIVTLEINHLV